jgi:ATP-dependent protease ClpP protease subunit
MNKTVAIYGYIYEHQARWFHDQIKEARKPDAGPGEILVRINTEGGQPDWGFSLITTIQQELSEEQALIEGCAHSMGLFALCYMKKENVSAIDVAIGVLHRGAYPSWMESSPEFPGSVQAKILKTRNAQLEKAFRNRVDIEALENLPQMKAENITVKDIFDMSKRVEVLLTAADLKKIGLVGKIVKITPEKTTEFKAAASTLAEPMETFEQYKLAAHAIVKETPNPSDTTQNSDTMDISELKAKHPALYALIKTEGTAEEKERVAAWMVFANIDAAAVKAGIESGKSMTDSQRNEFLLKAITGAKPAEAAVETTTSTEATAALATLAAAAAPDTKTTAAQLLATTQAATQTEAQKKKATMDAFLAEVDGNLGIKKAS